MPIRIVGFRTFAIVAVARELAGFIWAVARAARAAPAQA